MVNVRPDHPGQTPPREGSEGGRLTLLLTDGGWSDESWADRLPRLLSPMGVRALRAGCGREAADLLRRRPVHAAVVDLTLPLDARRAGASPTGEACANYQEAGPRLLELLARQQTHPPLIVVRQPRTLRDDARTLALAMKLGAFAVVDRPVDLEQMLVVLGKVVERYYRGRWPDEGELI